MNSLYNKKQGGEITMNSLKRAQLTLRIPKEKDQQLTEKSQKMGVSKNAVVLMAIDLFLKKQGKSA